MLTGPSILKIAYGVNVLSLYFPLPCVFAFCLADVKCILPEKSFDEEDIKHHKYTLPTGFDLKNHILSTVLDLGTMTCHIQRRKDEYRGNCTRSVPNTISFVIIFENKWQLTKGKVLIMEERLP